MRILLLGKTGQLGWELHRNLVTIGDLIALDYPEIDLTQLKAFKDIVLETRPDIIVNAAAYTNVDKAESEFSLAERINGQAPGVLAEVAKQLGAALLHFSTDYVFDGKTERPYIETDPTFPINAYGTSKLIGEQEVLNRTDKAIILRTSWMYSNRRENFLKKVLKWARTKDVLRIVTDQVGNPTSARFLAQVTTQMLLLGGNDFLDWYQQNHGIYHLAGDGYASRYEFTLEILHNDPNPEMHTYQELFPAKIEDFPQPAQRPAFSALDCTKFKRAFGISLPPWQEALHFILSDIP
jgi:dTDP-4-dehydrorhamnose reductase